MCNIGLTKYKKRYNIQFSEMPLDMPLYIEFNIFHLTSIELFLFLYVSSDP